MTLKFQDYDTKLEVTPGIVSPSWRCWETTGNREEHMGTKTYGACHRAGSLLSLCIFSLSPHSLADGEKKNPESLSPLPKVAS